MTDYLGDEAVKAIDANRNRSFFMYLAFNAPHVPLQALKSDSDALPQIKDHRLRVYGAMIRALDRNVGHVMSALKENGLDNDTLVIFTSDDGGANYIGLPYINRPYQGGRLPSSKAAFTCRSSCAGRQKISAGTTYNLPIAHTDIFATVARQRRANADGSSDGRREPHPFVTVRVRERLIKRCTGAQDHIRRCSTASGSCRYRRGQLRCGSST